MAQKKTIDCPTCQARLEYERVADIPHFPFCSRRCRLADLDKWLEGEYRISRRITGEDYVEEDDGNSGRRGEKP